MAAPFPSPTSTWHTTAYPAISPSRPELSAKGKAIAITGGGTGIGAETAHRFAEAGAARIALLGRREQPLLDTKASLEKKFPGIEVFTAATDVSNRSDVDAAFAKFAGNKEINVVVSNAATIGPQDPVKSVDPDKFLEAINKNLTMSLNVAQAFLRHAAPDGVAIDVSSSAAHVNFGDVFGSYSVAKLAVARMWDSLAAGSPDLSIFHVQPGVVNTDMNKEAGGVAAFGFEDHGRRNVGLLRRMS